MENKTYLTRKEVADLLRVSIITVDTYTKKGYLNAYGIGKRVLFNAVEVNDAITKI